MSDTPPSSSRAMLIAGAIVVVLAAIGAAVLLRGHPAPPRPQPSPAVQPATVQSAPAEASAPANGDCPPPATAPPMAPDGATATAAQMQTGRQKVQDFVNELEAYQACRNSQADHAGPMVTDAQKRAWVDQGNGAVDEANLLAHAFSVQLQAYEARGGH